MDSDDDYLGGIDYGSSDDDESHVCRVCDEEHCTIHNQMEDYPDESDHEDQREAVNEAAYIMDLLASYLRTHDANLVTVHGVEEGQYVLRQLDREFILGPTHHHPVGNPIQNCEVVFDFNASKSHQHCECASCRFNSLEDKTCNICFEEMEPNRKMVCKMPGDDPHFFHVDCLATWFNKTQEDGSHPDSCPVCRTSAIEVKGPHPMSSECVFATSIEPGKIAGHDEDTHIRIYMYSPSGVSHAGPFNGVQVNAYMPNNSEGKELTGLLERAWNQGLLYRVSRGQLVLNGIELKFNRAPTDGGLYSYPDPTYSMYLRGKLRALGIR